MSDAATKTKIAILGGGVAALAAAFDLTEADPNGDLYDITLYQLGWRLGGKGAVGWTCDKYPTPGFEGQRVQLEHGLHVWAGFYDNAFDLMKRLSQASDALRARPFDEIFTPLDRCWTMDNATGRYRRWMLKAPRNKRTPGIDGPAPSARSLWRRLLATLTRAAANKRLRTYIKSAEAGGPLQITQDEATFAEFARRIAHKDASAASGVRLSERKRVLALVAFATKDLRAGYFRPAHVGGERAGAPSEGVRRLAILINIGVALMLGLLHAGSLNKGFDELDKHEWSDWMGHYGAWPDSLTSSVVKGFYDYVFGYDEKGAPNIGAGTSTHAFLRLTLTYKGALFYRLNLTMGEFLFAPLYETLVKRNVKFEFFSRVDKLHLSADKKSINSIDIGVQAKLKDPNKPYFPLLDIPGGSQSWPARPDYDQLDKGGEIYATLGSQDLESPWNAWGVVGHKTLSRVKGTEGYFDKVILGVGLGALSTICEDLCNEKSLRWRAMIDKVAVCSTVATQMWTHTAARDYHWRAASPIVTGFADPLNTWGDNSHLIGQEAWSAGQPRGLGYFVGNFVPLGVQPAPNTPSDFPEKQLALARVGVDAWIANSLPVLWPGFKPGDVLAGPWVRVNVNPSDRYVQSRRATVKSRLGPDKSGVDNLYLAGDWVRGGINAGCIEQAVIAGRAAARAIRGIDMSEQGNGDDDGLLSPPLAGLLGNLPQLSKLAYAGVGSVDARCIVSYAPPQVLSKYLPRGLKFVFDGPTPNTMPFVILFSEQTRVRPGAAPFGGLDYLEFAIVLHGVYIDGAGDDYTGPYVYMPRILLNSYAPTLIGSSAYGLNKRMARMRYFGDSFQIRDREGEISAIFRQETKLGEIDDFKALGVLDGILNQPIVSETPQGDLIWSYINYHLDNATFQGLSGHCDIDQGPYASKFDFVPITDQRVAAETPFGFRMIADWSMTLPVRLGGQEGRKPKPTNTAAAAITKRMRAAFRGLF